MLQRSVKEENENLKDMNRTLEAKNQLYLQQLESEYRKTVKFEGSNV